MISKIIILILLICLAIFLYKAVDIIFFGGRLWKEEELKK